MNIAVTGYKGRLGSELIRRGCTPLEVDIRNRYDVFAAVNQIKPDVIINCAAYTDVNDCENAEGYARGLAVNYSGVKNLRENFDGLLVHLSTDYIWDGKKGPYSETAPYTVPINSYGLTKQGAEMFLTAYPEKPYCIVRTTCLYKVYNFDGRKDFVNKTLESLGEEGRFEASTQLSGNPTYVPHLAESILQLFDLQDIPTIIHLAGRESLTRYDFALMVAAIFGHDKEMVIPSKKAFWVGNRPKRGGFKVNLAEKLGLPIYSVIEGLEQYKKDLK
jgi:dTDP-4-dehydrorhamnose reductase